MYISITSARILSSIFRAFFDMPARIRKEAPKMVMKNAPKDNGLPEMKLLLRQKLAEKAGGPGALVDLYAGEGAAAMALSPSFTHVHAVERSPKKARALKQKIFSAGHENITVHNMDNKKFADQVLPRVKNIAMLDFDAWGSPAPLISRVFSRFRPEGPVAVAVTDGGRLALMRAGLTSAAALGLSADTAMLRAPCLSADEYALLVKKLWEGLAKKRGLIVEHHTAFWRRRWRTLYYGAIVKPA